jgi:hypothetical protein
MNAHIYYIFSLLLLIKKNYPIHHQGLTATKNALGDLAESIFELLNCVLIAD